MIYKAIESQCLSGRRQHCLFLLIRSVFLQQDQADPQNRLPPELMRRYDVVFVPRKLDKTLKLREIGSKHVGGLVTVQVKHVSALQLYPVSRDALNHEIKLSE